MITEDYVSFEVAKMLSPYFSADNTTYFYDEDGELLPWEGNAGNAYRYYPAPTLQMTMKWLREVHNLYIWIGHAAGKGLSWYYEIHGISDGKVKHIGGIQCGSYEVACEAAIKYCLTNLT